MKANLTPPPLLTQTEEDVPKADLIVDTMTHDMIYLDRKHENFKAAMSEKQQRGVIVESRKRMKNNNDKDLPLNFYPTHGFGCTNHLYT